MEAQVYLYYQFFHTFFELFFIKIILFLYIDLNLAVHFERSLTLNFKSFRNLEKNKELRKKIKSFDIRKIKSFEK